MALTYHCHICGRDIPEGLSFKEDSGKHDPAYHVAKAYHVVTTDWLCASDSKPWPCATITAYDLEPWVEA